MILSELSLYVNKVEATLSTQAVEGKPVFKVCVCVCACERERNASDFKCVVNPTAYFILLFSAYHTN